MNWQEVIKQEIDTAWKDGWLKGMEQKKSQIEKSKKVVSKIELKKKMLKYGFTAPDMTVTEFVEDFETL